MQVPSASFGDPVDILKVPKKLLSEDYTKHNLFDN